MPSTEGDLPPERLRHHQPPFTCTGVDYFGPMTMTIGRRHEKRYGALFTCLTTRAVHIELAEFLSSDSMILALRRFIPRRGTPRMMYSDNSTNFVVANKELINMEEVHEKTNKEVDIHLLKNLLMRSLKTALAATLREKSLREEVLHTLLLEAEHIVNSRPLTEVDIEPTEAGDLTPNHFLIGRFCGVAAAGHFDDNVLLGPANWRACQRLADHFWQRWLRKYLPTLVPLRARGDPMCRAPAEGDIVLIVDSSSPRYSWPRGRIKKTYPGPDNQVRVVDVETTDSVLQRPTSKIVLLVSSEATAVPCPEV
ncbi:hypothetical protein EVAR_22244_1 [Eumeta japonica]|uniref:DUF5641 domain-containing protein n=1 Tax=Eumeta variegata TaxID=151549 RepID=A0A4C1UBR1_EUMVA|nr:hypothetical protein EVAR_22244_1 [Eumeta japonica]